MLCTYNGERFLEAQIDSLLQQTWSNFEVIVSDDHSSDSTSEILQRYAADPRFKISYQTVTLGAIANFEFATRQASGEYIAFCDQDDIWLPEKLEKLYAAIDDYWLVYCDSILIDDNGNSLQKKLSGLRRMYSGKDTRGFVFSNVVWGHAMMVNRKLLEHVLPIPSGIPHDIWFAVKAAGLTGIRYLDEALTLYRQHSSTVTTTIATITKARSTERRYYDATDKLNWIGILRDHAVAQKDFFNKLYHLYSLKIAGLYSPGPDRKFIWPLFFFLIQHQKELFQFTYKNYPSRVVEIIKQSRGESL